jgi:hypothetical protein
VLAANDVGRGPTIDISPRITLRICGSSSRLVFRRNPPTRVMRGSFGILKSGGGRMLRCWSEAFSSSAFWTIVRNLNIGKRTPCWPVRCWAKSTGPGDSSRMASTHSSPTGRTIGSASRLRPRSSARLVTA